MSERYSANPNQKEVGADQPHVMRYLIARGFITPNDVVADISCGPGYGSALLAQVAKSVFAIDKDDCFEEKWRRDNITFIYANIEKGIEFDIEIDAIVSIETIEHLEDPQAWLDKVTKGGIPKLIISSPDMDTVGENEFHLTNVKFSDLQKMMAKYPDYRLYSHCMVGTSYVAFYIHKDHLLI